MPKAAKKSVCEKQNLPHMDTNVPESQQESASTDQEPDAEVSSIHPKHQVIPSMYMPYIEGLKMDWTVNDGLYHCFLKWKLKCENILECELAALPEKQQCKKVIAWIGDFEMDEYISWSLPKEELNLETILDRFEEFCKLHSNEVRAHFDLLKSFHQGNKSVDEWYNTIQAQVNLARYAPETAKILHHDIFWFLMRDEDFVSRTINEGSVHLEKFPANKVCQLAKKLESSKATARHIRQVAGDPQAAQINLM